MNSLLQDFNTPHGTIPFTQLREEDYLPAVQEEIKKALAQIDAITASTRPADFENTIEALDRTGEKLNIITSAFFNLNSAHTNDNIQSIAREISPLLTDFANDIKLNQKLYRRVREVYDNRENLGLTPEQETLLTKQYKNFVRNGASLDQEDQQKLRNLDKELAALKLAFGENVLADTNAYSLELTEDDLDGLPQNVIDAARETAQSMDKDGYVFNLQYPSYVPFMKYSARRDLREKLALAFGARGYQDNDNNNSQNVLDISRLREDRARILGYATHAHYVLEERMAKDPETVITFLQDLLHKAKPAAQRELEELHAFAKAEDNIAQLQKWDSAYYSEKLKKQRYDLDDQALKPYFSLENVLRGAFNIAGKLYGLTFSQVDNIEVYHEDVKTYEVYDEDGRFMSVFYTDFFPRSSKRPGAWMTSYKDQAAYDGQQDRPHVSIVCNFTPPTSELPSLLTFNEVTTLFHEFGHALHGILADTTYRGLSGTSVHWDFVELPSQILENWCYEPEALQLFAKHYETGEVIPMEFITKIKEAASFMEGMQTLRQVSFGMLDMHWHGGGRVAAGSTADDRVKETEQRAMDGTQLFPDVDTNCMSTAFAHIFQGGYSAGYYSYKWAEVLDADAFEKFLEDGILNSETGRAFRKHILSRGGTEDPMDLYVRFRGSKPSVDALLKRAGLVSR